MQEIAIKWIVYFFPHKGLFTLILLRVWMINWFPHIDLQVLTVFCYFLPSVWHRVERLTAAYCSLVFRYVFLWLLLPVWSGQGSLISCFSKPRCLSCSPWVKLGDLLSARPSSLEPAEVGNAHWLWSCHLQARHLSETR